MSEESFEPYEPGLDPGAEFPDLPGLDPEPEPFPFPIPGLDPEPAPEPDWLETSPFEGTAENA